MNSVEDVHLSALAYNLTQGVTVTWMPTTISFELQHATCAAQRMSASHPCICDNSYVCDRLLIIAHVAWTMFSRKLIGVQCNCYTMPCDSSSCPVWCTPHTIDDECNCRVCDKVVGSFIAHKSLEEYVPCTESLQPNLTYTIVVPKIDRFELGLDKEYEKVVRMSLMHRHINNGFNKTIVVMIPVVMAQLASVVIHNLRRFNVECTLDIDFATLKFQSLAGFIDWYMTLIGHALCAPVCRNIMRKLFNCCVTDDSMLVHFDYDAFMVFNEGVLAPVGMQHVPTMCVNMSHVHMEAAAAIELTELKMMPRIQKHCPVDRLVHLGRCMKTSGDDDVKDLLISTMAATCIACEGLRNCFCPLLIGQCLEYFGYEVTKSLISKVGYCRTYIDANNSYVSTDCFC